LTEYAATDYSENVMSLFVDEVTIDMKAGDGGNGAVAFRKEKFVPRGGPAGGDGGKGGDVVLCADSNLSTLLDFRYQRIYKAPRGVDGSAKQMYGKNAEDLLLRVPLGTIATDVESGRIIADLTKHDQREVVATGGMGGRGNAHFASSTHQAPQYAENGEPGELRTVKLELKLLADVGIIGFPNVGKSSIIAAISAARPKIANYPFTTLIPNLGVVQVDKDPNRTFVMADIPGLIEGASDGIGLGHQFLRHIERTRLLAHVIDVSDAVGRDPLEDFRIVNQELERYSAKLAGLTQIVVLNKIDIADPEKVESTRRSLAEFRTVVQVSAATQQGLKELVYLLANTLDELPRQPDVFAEGDDDGPVLINLTNNPGGYSYRTRQMSRRWEARFDEESGAFVVAGKGIERVVAMTPLLNEHAVARLQRVLEKAGIVSKLRSLGAKEGDTVRIGTAEFDFFDEDIDE